jgi:capsular polysaccharide export protein
MPHSPDDAAVAAALAAVRAARVGGSYWGAQPALPTAGFTLWIGEGIAADAVVAADGPLVVWGDAVPAGATGPIVARVRGVLDPWHIIAAAGHVIVSADNEAGLIAAILGKPLTVVGAGRFAALGESDSLHQLFARHVLAPFDWRDCFTDAAIPFAEAVRLCGFWRALIDSNRDIGAALGFAFWKRPTAAPLLWSGGEVPFADSAPVPLPEGRIVAVWRSRTDPAELARLDHAQAPMAEVEDGFIRSVGLGADCVPPLSIVVDRRGIYFDPSRASDLEALILSGGFTPEMLARAARLRELIVASGISKYAVEQGGGQDMPQRRGGDRRHILVPGQVEDDRSVQSGGGAVSTNLELLRRARADAPDAYILYKPHPDVEAGHRIGSIADTVALGLADEVVRDGGIGPLIAMVDELQVNTSLAGFEALLRGRAVTVHGAPFYAGWGLTRDLGAVPARRNVTRSLDELVAAVLLLYPRYLDPVTGLPCPPEVLIDRLTRQLQPDDGMIVRARRWQGRIRRVLGGWRRG